MTYIYLLMVGADTEDCRLPAELISRWYLAKAPIATAAMVVLSFLSLPAPLLCDVKGRASRPSLRTVLYGDIADMMDLCFERRVLDPLRISAAIFEKI